MPVLDWIGKDKIINHHHEVPYKVLERKYSFDETGQHEEDNGSENMIIHGDNLYALKTLLPKYEGRIDCVCIDPPYNTGNEKWVYNDNVNDPQIKRWIQEVVGPEGEDLSRHDKWLCMMYPRLRLIQKLLKREGTLVISISIHELANLLELCKEIFSTKNIQIVTVKMSGGKPSNGFIVNTEYLVFVTSDDFKPAISENAQNEYSSPYHGMNLATFNQVQRPNQVYPIYINEKGAIVGTGKSLAERVELGDYTGPLEDFVYDFTESPEGCISIWPVTEKGYPCVWRLIAPRLINDWRNGFIKVVPIKSKKNQNKYSIQYLAEGIIDKIRSKEFTTYRISDDPDIPTLEVNNFKTGGIGIQTLWDDTRFQTSNGSNEIASIFGDKNIFSYPKPLDLIMEIMSRITSENSLVLDSFAGSGTTGHAILELNKKTRGNRKFILIEMLDYAESVTSKRLQSVISGYNGTPGTGGSYSYYELGDSILNSDCNLNTDLPIEKIREYIWYTETQTPYISTPVNNPFLGKYCDVGYYFIYCRDKRTTLNESYLSILHNDCEKHVIYADVCTLTETTRKERNIEFRKIPRDIRRL